MGQFVIGRRQRIFGWLIAVIILGLNVKLVIDQFSVWIAESGGRGWLLQATLLPLAAGLIALVCYVAVHPWLKDRSAKQLAVVSVKVK
jgi:manganese transport protein